MADGGNYSFSSHNLQTPAMRQSFNRPAKLLQHRQLESPEKKIGSPSSNSSGSRNDASFIVKEGDPQTVRFVPHPPSSPRLSAVDTTPQKQALLNSKGVKRSRHESPWNSPSGSEDERRIHKHAFNVMLDPLPLKRSGSTGSLDSMGSSESLGSPRNKNRNNRNLRGVEPLKDIGSDRELVNSFKSYQSSARNEESGKKIVKKNVVHPMKVTQEQNDISEDVSVHKETTVAKPNTEQLVLLKNKMPSEDEVTLSSSNDSLTSVSDSEENSMSNSDASESKSHGKAMQRDPNSTLPALPSPENDRTLAANSSGVYESIRPNEHNRDCNNSASDLRNLSKALEKVATNDERYASDTDLSMMSTGQASNISTLSLLPRVPARRARTRSGNFLKEEMERYFPDHQIGVFVATWNMHEEKVTYTDVAWMILYVDGGNFALHFISIFHFENL